ncbi:MAG: tetratricopeptide repeat protein [Planctomycetota bacterium]
MGKRLLTIATWGSVLAAILLIGGPVLAAEAVAEDTKKEAEAKPADQPAETPEQAEAQALLKRLQAEIQVKKDQERFRAQQHVRTGKHHFDMQNWKDALRHFEKAIELDPQNQEAQEYLKKTRGMLSIGRKEFGDLAKHYADHLAIARQVQRTELNNMFAEAKTLYERGKYVQAVEQFTRVAARARYLSPSIDVGKTAEEAEALIQKCMQALEERQAKQEQERLAAAREEAERLREAREKLLDERIAALYKQATTLFEERRYEEAREVCDEILREDPTNGAAESLREAAVEAGRNKLIEQALKKRKVETERHWQQTRAYTVPQTEIVYMPREQFEEVRARTVATAFGGEETEPEAWEARIKEAMGKKVSFDFVETPLQDVIAFISSLTDVTIVLDQEAIRGEEPTVTLRVDDMRLEAALNWVLKLVNLKYTLKNEAIFVSKPESIHDKPVLRMYDVTDLTIDIKNFQGRQQALASDGGYSSTGSSGSGGGGQDELGEDFFGVDDKDDEEDRLTGESLVEFIKRTIAPGTWADDMGGDFDGGGGDDFGGGLDEF